MSEYTELKRLAAAAMNAGISEGDALRSACRPTVIWDLIADHDELVDLRARLAERDVQAIERAAKWVDRRLNEYVRDHGMQDPDTGTMEFPGDGAEYAEELDFIAHSIRGLSASADPSAPVDSSAKEVAQNADRYLWMRDMANSADLKMLSRLAPNEIDIVIDRYIEVDRECSK